MITKIKDRVGIRYGRLIVTKFVGKTLNREALWLCKCDCGNETIVKGNNLQRGNTKSCGCLNREIISKINNKRMGKNNPNYINGKYSGKRTKAILELKEKIRKRDNYICQHCCLIQEQNGKILDVHHIDGDDTNNVEENMITLCRSCHRRIKRTETRCEKKT